jgi:hypothetical protein
MQNQYMVITPINKNKKANSNVDYKEQLIRTSSGECIWCWDDSMHNTAQVGEYFGFYFYGIKVIVHIITAVKDTTERLPSWSQNVGQGDRRVLELSNPLFEIDWNTWIDIGGAKRSMGTFRTTELRKKHARLYYHLNTMRQDLERHQDLHQDQIEQY